VSSDQLRLFDTGPRARMNKTEAGLAKEGVGRGAERLLGEMVKRGLGEEHLHRAASLCLLLDEERAPR
jgi:hypothetical protein